MNAPDPLAEHVALSEAELTEIRAAGRYSTDMLQGVITPFGTAVKVDGKWRVLAPRYQVWDGIKT